MKLCKTCNHPKKDHIYEEGDCRPGFICEFMCEKFVDAEALTERDQQILEQAKHEDSDGFFGFISGAEWADANNDRTRAVLHLEHRCQDLAAQLEIAMDALDYIKWPGPDRDHWDRVNKAKDAVTKIRGMQK